MAESEAVARYRRVRAASEALAAGLTPEDMGAQAMPDASPFKWHLAHTTWFFETFVLAPHRPDRPPFDPAFRQLFNSYYESVGERPPRPERGLLTRPALAAVLTWRREVDDAMAALLAESGPGIAALLDLGLAHEEQHQELMVTDLLALFARHPLEPAWRNAPPPQAPLPAAGWIAGEAGVAEVGHDGRGFAFDNEGPRHPVLLAPYRIARRPVTNGEILAFIADGGYRNPLLWQEEGWDEARRSGWTAPGTWRREAEGHRDSGAWTMMTVAGRLRLDPDAAATHLSWWEADAYARWAGARLPTEEEWEAACSRFPYGQVWEWTASAHRPYPGWRAPGGAFGEYNGKFMAGRFVLKGGSAATPPGHSRPSYRNFFPPSSRWQFTGLRLAEDA